MKALFVGLLTCVCVQVADAQVIRVPVGVSHLVSNEPTGFTSTKSCRNSFQDCLYSMIPAFYELPGGYNKYTYAEQNPIHNYIYSFHYSYSNGYALLYFTSDTLCLFNDTVSYGYSLYNVVNDCGASCSQYLSNIEQYNIASYYDSLVRVNTYGKDTLVFPRNPDDTYSDIKNYSFGIFNNRSDSLYCDSISFVVDSNIMIEMNLLPDAMRYTDFVVHPFDRIIPSLYFSTDVGLFSDSTFVNSAIKIYAKSRSEDTVIVVPITFLFTPREKSSVAAKGNIYINKLKVLNPVSQGRLSLLVNLNHSIDTKIECYDLLGARLNSLYNGFLDSGEHEFSAELPAGMYYVRMQAGDEVLTRKVTVVR